MPMRMKRRIIKLGNAKVISLPKRFTDYYQIQSKDSVEIFLDGKLVVYPSEEAYEADKEKLKAFLEK